MQMYRVVPITKRGSFYEYTCEDSCEMEKLKKTASFVLVACVAV